MTMLHVFKELVKEYGYEPHIRIHHTGRGISNYDIATDTITLYLAGKNYAEKIFILLHEYRHAIQKGTAMFPELLNINGVFQPNDSSYLDLPWEKEANEWAVKKGIEMGFFLPGYLPHWLKRPDVLDGGWR